MIVTQFFFGGFFLIEFFPISFYFQTQFTVAEEFPIQAIVKFGYPT